MSRVENIEQEIQALSPQEVAELRKWFSEFDAALWDRQIEQDAAAGKLDRLADEALADLKSGNCKPL